MNVLVQSKRSLACGKYRLVLVLSIAITLLAACGGSGGTSDNGTPQAPSNALKITIAYSPEKEGWLKDRIAAFNATNAKVGGQTVFVEGVNKSSGAARTEIKNGQLKPTIWSPSASIVAGGAEAGERQPECGGWPAAAAGADAGGDLDVEADGRGAGLAEQADRLGRYA